MQKCRTILGLIVGAVLLAAPAALANEKKDPPASDKQGAVQGLKLTGKLTEDDPRDKMRTSSYSKSHPFQMEAGKIYRIDVMSKEFDPFIRLEDPKGKQAAWDDDGGEGLNARLVHRPKKSGEYTIVVTSFPPNQTGKYTLAVKEGTPEELAEWQANNFRQLSAAERKGVLGEIRKRLLAKGEKLGMNDVQAAFGAAQALESESGEQAAETYKAFAKALSASADPKVRKMARSFEGAARRADLVGHEMEVKGTTLAGKELDWKAYKGKVVLVDFWATWCGPCVAEVPNIKKMYEKYHDAGFDVVGISLDHSKSAVEKFMDQKELPWVCVYDADLKEGESMADYYGIRYIPQAILVGRDGRVISLNARGEQLGALLEKHIGDKE